VRSLQDRARTCGAGDQPNQSCRAATALSWFHLSLTAIQLVLLGARTAPLAWDPALAPLVAHRCGRGERARAWPCAWTSRSCHQPEPALLRVRKDPARRHSHARPSDAEYTCGAFRASPATATLPRLPEGPHRPDADIVLITIDAVRADHLGCYGYARPTTPNIDALAARGVRFEHAYTQAPHTSFSLASLMIGKYYPTLARLAPSDTHETLAKLLRRYGWKTAAFFPPAVFLHRRYKMKAFEANNFDFEYVKYEFLGAEGRVGQIEDFLRVENPRKLFLWLHLFEPHEPYERHPGFDFGPRDVDRYDSEIAYADSVVGKVVKIIERKRPGAIVIWPPTMVKNLAIMRALSRDDPVRGAGPRPAHCRGPGACPACCRRPDAAHRHLGDRSRAARHPVAGRMRGTDLGPWLVNPPAPSGRLPPAFAEVEDKRMVALASERLICDVGKDYCSYFDVGSDPREQHDMADQRPDRVALCGSISTSGWGSRRAMRRGWWERRAAGGDSARLIERARLAMRMWLPYSRSCWSELRQQPCDAKAASLLVTALPPRPETLNALLDAVTTATDDDVRDWAAVAAARLGSVHVQERVRAILAKQSTEATQVLHVQAALALAEQADKTGLPILADALDSCGGDISLCKRIVAVLGDLKDGRAARPLIEHLAFVQTRRETVEALSAIADPASVSALVACLTSDEYVPVRWRQPAPSDALAVRTRCKHWNRPSVANKKIWSLRPFVRVGCPPTRSLARQSASRPCERSVLAAQRTSRNDG